MAHSRVFRPKYGRFWDPEQGGATSRSATEDGFKLEKTHFVSMVYTNKFSALTMFKS